jgi:AraC family transcriptional regulator
MTSHTHLLAAGAGWSVSNVLCTAGPKDRPFEERHDWVCVVAVVSGTFQYRTGQRRATLAPGALMLGNEGGSFECSHEHGAGDHCLSCHYEPGWFENIVASVPGARRAGFSVPRIPPSDSLLPLLAAAEAAADPLEMEEIALRMAAAAVMAQDTASLQAVSVRDERRVSATLRLIETQPEHPVTVADLAQAVAMSPYHFLRSFRAVVGMTPYQFILGQRLRRAAGQLRQTCDPIAEIAFDAGFGDLSSFNRRFRRVVGVPPSTWRRLGVDGVLS